MLQIESLVKVYPEPVTALQGVDLDLEVGMFGLLGPNGAGKTTLMRIVAGLLEPTSGVVTLDGEDILAKPERVRARLGYLPQECIRRALSHRLPAHGLSPAEARRD